MIDETLKNSPHVFFNGDLHWVYSHNHLKQLGTLNGSNVDQYQLGELVRLGFEDLQQKFIEELQRDLLEGV